MSSSWTAPSWNRSTSFATKLTNAAEFFGAPRLTGTGALVQGTTTSFTLANGNPGAQALLILGLSSAYVPFGGGILVPSPDILLPFTVDPFGGQTFVANWPAGLPHGSNLYLHAWIVDPAGPAGWSASNALQVSP